AERFQFGLVRDPSAIFMLLAIFFWFIAYNGVETWLSTYGTKHLGHQAYEIGGLLTFSGGAFLLMAIPAGFIAAGSGRRKGLGRKNTILIGIIGMAAAYFLMMGLGNLKAGIPYLVLAGVSWAFVNINSYPMVAEMAPVGQIGTYTGLYYLFSNGSNIASPPLFGWVFDTYGYTYFFPVAIGAMVLAFLCMLMVRKGEAVRSPQMDAAD
ncbi:MAG TPA: MFS transporter, partial [Symbiobacteriaceae bacterium]|nr:MFS transporter [Symbiobacteriaceae bacterium]